MPVGAAGDDAVRVHLVEGRAQPGLSRRRNRGPEQNCSGDFDRHANNKDTTFADYLKGRLKHEPGSVDGILCWNFFDYLDVASAQVLAASLTKLIRTDGSVLAFFTTVGAPDTRFSKYVIMDEDSVRARPYSSGGKKQTALQNRDIIRMFQGLKVSESFLLKTNVREFLFRKPAQDA